MNNLVLSDRAKLSIAIACHSANAAYAASLGDDSIPPWDDAAEHQRASCLNGVDFHIANPDAGPDASHENWRAVKEADGWVFGDKKDEKKKTHPCIVPFVELPQEQQFKDVLFKTVFLATAIPIAALEGELAEASKATDKAKADLKVAKAQAKPKSAKARPIGAIDGEQPRGEDLLTLIGAAETVELVFSDGKREITALAPQLIEGDAWYQAANGVRLRVPSLAVNGPGRDDAALKVAGYGLVLDGELTAYSPRMDVLTILPGSQHELKDDVIFG